MTVGGRLSRLAEHGVPLRTVVRDLHQSAGTHGHHGPSAVGLLQRRQHGLVDRDVRDAEVAREQLHMRQRVAGASRKDAGDWRQVSHRFGQHVDAVGSELAGALHFRARVQHAARDARIERVETGRRPHCRRQLLRTPACRLASRFSASSACE